MKHILVPVDFSENSFHAARFSCKVAEQINAAIHLLHVMELGHEKIYQPFSVHEKYNNLVIDENLEALNELKNNLKVQYPLLQINSQLLSGEVDKTIFNYVKDEAVDLIIIGNTGTGMAIRVLFGSIAEKIMKSSPVPVITVPVKAEILIPERIVFATKHFEKDEKVLAPLIEISKFFKASLHIVFFLNSDMDNVPYYMDNALRLDHFVHYLKLHYKDINFIAKIIEGEELISALEQYEKDIQAHMLALVPYAKGFLEKLQSVSSKLAFQSSIPVLILPSGNNVITKNQPLSTSSVFKS